MLTQQIAAINKTLDVFFLIVAGTGIILFNIKYIITIVGREIKKIQKNRDGLGESRNELVLYLNLFGKTIYFWLLFAIPQIITIGMFWFFPIYIHSFVAGLDPEILRWILVFSISLPIAYVSTKKFGGMRGFVSMTAHLAVLLTGWLMGRWLGMFFISIPLLGSYYYILYRLAEVMIPASNPESQAERFEKFKVLTWYMWGSQYPIIFTSKYAGWETRINGSISQDFLGIPGYIWTNAYQVAGLTSGTNFSRVEGPGAIYTHKYEQVHEVVDLRTQLRTKVIQAITQEGIPIKATIFAAFCIDRAPLDNTLHSRVRHAGSFPYSRPRVRAVISMASIKASTSGSNGKSLRWDEQVMSHVEEAARQVIAETPLVELWHPNLQEDGRGISSTNIIAERMQLRLKTFLQENFIQLFTVRLVNYSLYKDEGQDASDGINDQQISIWKSHWKQRAEQMETEAVAEAEKKQLEATARAHAMLLKSIAESLKTVPIKEGLPRFLVAMRFLNIIDDMIREQPDLAGDKGKELMERIATIRGYS